MKEKFLNSPHAYLIENSPMELLNDRECVLYSLKNKFESWRIIYEKNPSIIEEDDEIREFIRNKFLNGETYFSITTPIFILSDVEIIVKSLEYNVDNINFAVLTQEEYSKIVPEIMRIAKYDDLTGIDNVGLITNIDFLTAAINKYPNLFFKYNIYYYYPKVYEEIKPLIIKLMPLCNENDIKPFYSENKHAFEDKEVMGAYLRAFPNTAFRRMSNELLLNNVDYFVDIQIEMGRTINNNTPKILRENPKYQLFSIKNDPNSVNVFGVISAPEVVNYVLDNELFELFPNISINNFSNPKLKNSMLNQDNHDEDSFSDNQFDALGGIVDDIIQEIENGLSVSTIKKLIHSYAEKDFKTYKTRHAHLLGNVYQCVTSLLKETDTLLSFMMNFPLYNSFNKVFGEERVDRIFGGYFDNKDNKSKVEPYIREIAKMCRDFGDLYKQRYIKEIKTWKLDEIYPKLFILRSDSPQLLKQIKEKIQINYFYSEIAKNNREYIEIYNSIIEKIITNIKTDYKLDPSEIENIARNIVFSRNPKLIEPPCYKNLLIFVELEKVINRLNKGNINENSLDYQKYSKYLKVRNVNGKKEYYSDYFTFTKEELEDCNHYIACLQVVKMFNSSVMPYIKKIDVEINEEDLKRVKLDFNDKNYRFNPEVWEKIIIGPISTIETLINSINDKDKFELIRKLIFDEQLFLLAELNCLNLDNCSNFEDIISEEQICQVLEQCTEIARIIGIENMKIDRIYDLIAYSELTKTLSKEDIEVLGPILINYTMNNNAFNPNGMEISERLARSRDLLYNMNTKDGFTVPRIHGKLGNYNYSVMEQDDPHFLTCGFETDACFRVGGHDNDFLHYCALNKNGFVIKLEDKDGKFIGRASGFRNGNTIYINQLRTIYDMSGNKTKHIPLFLKRQLIEVLKACCDDIIKTTQETIEPVDYVLITKSYSLEDIEPGTYGPIVTRELEDEISSESIVNMDCIDWKETVSEPGYDGTIDEAFTTDYGNYDTLVIACSNPLQKELRTEHIIHYDAKALYHRNRLIPQTVTLTQENIEYFNKIKMINCRTNLISYEPINPDLIGAQVTYGTNFYIIHNGEEIIDFSNNPKDYIGSEQHFEETSKINGNPFIY